MMSLGKGAVLGISKKQKIITQTSTEAKLVGVNDTIPKTYSYQHKDVNHTPQYFMRTRRSNIQLEINCRQSSGQCIQHLNIVFFYQGLSWPRLGQNLILLHRDDNRSLHKISPRNTIQMALCTDHELPCWHHYYCTIHDTKAICSKFTEVCWVEDGQTMSGHQDKGQLTHHKL